MFADALTTLRSQIPFKGRDTLVRIGKQEHSIIRILQWDWRSEVKEKMKKVGSGGN